MRTARVAIVGGGLSGLYAAFLLEQRGVQDYVLIEARERFNGRIASLSAGGAATPGNLDRFDLGPTWYWPELQPGFDQLVRELGLQVFEQHEAGDMVVERSPGARPMRMRGYASSPSALRLDGGMETLTDALRRKLDPARLVTGRHVRRLRCTGPHVELEAEDVHGIVSSWRVEHVLLAAPPRLCMATMAFAPALPQALSRQWQDTATWMAPHAKYVAVYDTPFWRGQGLSGEARSMAGPLGEIHDASMPGGAAALFGFLGVPAQARMNIPEDVLRSHCRAQLARLFGPQAATPRADALKDWALDPCTATAADVDGAAHHAAAPDAAVASGPWAGRLTGIASEWSPSFPGYLAGAVEAAQLGVVALLGTGSVISGEQS
ncbi:flavin monoamine oxidase family protein [Azohydromonas australica]|uniref:flavin monoamine oxidase family protein n=1 Tax=Azohydromonas australica TaxID=364039 RepID=UPI0004257775|nr:FAD-dependent oxidoreductase [Azohydromonas australica]